MFVPVASSAPAPQPSMEPFNDALPVGGWVGGWQDVVKGRTSRGPHAPPLRWALRELASEACQPARCLHPSTGCRDCSCEVPCSGRKLPPAGQKACAWRGAGASLPSAQVEPNSRQLNCEK